MTEAGLAPGSSVLALGGRLVHLDVRPGESPPVLLLGGCGVPSYVWDPVAQRLPDRYVVRLDRPGLLGTPWPGTLPRLSEEVATLADLVERIGAPAVVVAHSMAGFHAEALARQHPAAVSGLLLLDASVEWDPKPATGLTAWLRLARATRRAMSLRPLRRIGPVADRVLVSVQSNRRQLFDPVDPVARETYRRPDTVASVIAEQAAYAEQVLDLAEVRRGSPWPGTPTTVVTAAGDGGPDWVDDQRRLADLLSGRQVVVEDSRHLVMIDRPDIVAEQVCALVDAKDSDSD